MRFIIYLTEDDAVDYTYSLIKSLKSDFENSEYLVFTYRNKSKNLLKNIDKTSLITDIISQDEIGINHFISNKINLEKYILTFNPNNKKIKIEDKIISDSCEALIGAIYLEKGLASAEKVILDLWKNNIVDSIITQIDAKTKLQELSLKNFKKLPIYKLISNTGPRHKPSFKVGVKLPNTKYFFGSGKSKKDAEQNAAFLCIEDVFKK